MGTRFGLNRPVSKQGSGQIGDFVFWLPLKDMPKSSSPVPLETDPNAGVRELSLSKVPDSMLGPGLRKCSISVALSSCRGDAGTLPSLKQKGEKR